MSLKYYEANDITLLNPLAILCETMYWARMIIVRFDSKIRHSWGATLKSCNVEFSSNNYNSSIFF